MTRRSVGEALPFAPFNAASAQPDMETSSEALPATPWGGPLFVVYRFSIKGWHL